MFKIENTNHNIKNAGTDLKVGLKNTHYYRLTEEGYVWLYNSLFNYSYFVNPLLSKRNEKGIKQRSDNPSKIEQAYSMINSAVSLVISELGLVA